MNNILIFGTFNPVTNAHINMGVLAKRKYPDAKIIYVPCRDDYISHYKEEKDLIFTTQERTGMLLNSIFPYEDFCISLVEIKNIVSGYTYQTVQWYSNPIIVLGADKLETLYLWQKAEKLVAENKFLVITRNNNKGRLPLCLKEYEDHFEYIDGGSLYQDVSSSQIREAHIKCDLDSVKNYIPECVYGYLKCLEEGVTYDWI